MSYKGSEAYDHPDFFKKYTTKRAKGNAVNEILEQPIIDALIGKVQDKSILDLGCGEGQYGKMLLEQGAKAYSGIDGSKNMTDLAAQHLKGMNAQVQQINLEAFEFPSQSFDIVLARLVFHYIEDLRPIFKRIYQSLKEDGCLVFSVEHPIITSSYRQVHRGVRKESWIVDHYFNTGERDEPWWGINVITYHRTIEDYFYLAKNTGFNIEAIKESKPERSYFEEEEEYNRRMRIPLFLMMKLSV